VVAAAEGIAVLKSFFTKMYENASEMNRQNLISLTRRAGAGSGVKKLLDLGCDDGLWTKRLADAVGAEEVHGVEVVEEPAQRARANGVKVYSLDLNRPLTDIPSNTFDLVHANQVIEHVSSVDLFVSEVYRVLRPGGHAVISTENGSSWHNVFAAFMGWQIFSLTNVSSLKAGLGNPFAIQRGSDPFTGTWTHKTIFNYRGLIEMFETHGFRSAKIAGAGYFPLPAFLGRIDPRHSAFITVFAQK
jgi:2-polyprenyl-3-methyl-5-hydroxy-6-metoxy-1,4-benzoquinol methylase